MIRQRTIKEAITVEGIGLQTGKKAKLTLKSSPPLSGINFIRTDLPNKPLLNIQSIDLTSSASPERRTALGMGQLQIQTTEHLMAALSGLSIDNIVMELDNIELPGLDGSAKGFTDAILQAGVVEQDAPRRFLKIDKPVWCQGAGNFLAVFPEEGFRISYTMAYEHTALGTRFFSMVINEDNFKKEIAPARTFCLEAEALELLKRGLGKGANYENTLVMGKDGPIGNKLRFPDEPVRHKVLDLIGDLYLAGMPVKGHVVAIKSGHVLNMELVRQLRSLS
ncbi:MAG: UDP-3-O-acyl-N-acetylglucosamine deacetylase [Candidatus Omnitrophota bacterium]|nr:UDP-3-O-acyl-N-acetylglucosamine deacetylase [Candidatus Omnitrophota bacterium]